MLCQYVFLLDHEAVEAQIMSDVNSKTQNIVSTIDNIKEDIKMFLDQNIGQTKTKVCDVLASSIEVRKKNSFF